MKSAALAGGFLFLAAFGAHAAPSPDAVASALAAAVAATGEGTLTYDSAAAAGDAVTLTNVKVASPHSSASVPTLIVAGLADRPGGGFTATHISFDNGTATSRGDTVTWAAASLDDVIIPSADEVKARTKLRPFARITASGIAASGATLAAPVAVGTLVVDVGPIAEDAPSNILVKASGVKLPTALIANSMAGAIVAMLDYDTVNADITMDSAYDTKADTVTVHLLSVDAAGIGKLTVTGKASGLSLKGLTGDAAKSKEARAAARLDGLTVRIDNAGIVERMLDMQAQLLGGTRDDVRSQLVDGALPFALSFVKNAAFRDQFQAAVAAFLNDPKSLTITFAPAQPVPLGEVMRTAGRSPTALPDLLSPTVQANN
jgi:hypothetical protein